jgi:hypothetical protein
MHLTHVTSLALYAGWLTGAKTNLFSLHWLIPNVYLVEESRTTRKFFRDPDARKWEKVRFKPSSLLHDASNFWRLSVAFMSRWWNIPAIITQHRGKLWKSWLKWVMLTVYSMAFGVLRNSDVKPNETVDKSYSSQFSAFFDPPVKPHIAAVR